MGHSLISGHSVFVSDEDAGLLESHQWHIHRSGTKLYVRGYPRGSRKNGLVYLHRVILSGVPEVDHRDGDGLNNRRANLRPATRSQNCSNKSVKGVHFDGRTQKWRAEVQFCGTRYRLGRFATQQEAVEARNAKAQEVHGEFYRAA
jgi:hypothetical protein